MNTEIAHEQIFYKIKGNLYSIGFNKGYWLRYENEKQYINEYKFSEIYHVDTLTINFFNIPRFDPQINYDIATHNCQDYADAVAVRIRHYQGYGSPR